MRQELETSLLGVLTNELERVHAAFDERLRILTGPIPNDVVHEVEVVSPALADLGVVEEHTAVTDRVTDRVDSEIEQLVDRLDVLANAHGRFVEVNARVSAVGVEEHFLG